MTSSYPKNDPYSNVQNRSGHRTVRNRIHTVTPSRQPIPMQTRRILMVTDRHRRGLVTVDSAPLWSTGTPTVSYMYVERGFPEAKETTDTLRYQDRSHNSVLRKGLEVFKHQSRLVPPPPSRQAPHRPFTESAVFN